MIPIKTNRKASNDRSGYYFAGNCTQSTTGVVSTVGTTAAGLTDLPRYPGWMALTGGNYTVLAFSLLLVDQFPPIFVFFFSSYLLLCYNSFLPNVTTHTTFPVFLHRYIHFKIFLSTKY